ncbi:hypothetical protein V6N11_050254 [Hibiscus sabdariffa]|uniref:Uncharacterized protein n=1 Tax=Hibiscus sabdariffa TaxID=183260 RepID=A0ABR2T9A4_9ROSI
MRSRRGGDINNPSSKGKEVEVDNYGDDAFDDSDDDDLVDENAFDDFTDEIFTDEFNSYWSQRAMSQYNLTEDAFKKMWYQQKPVIKRKEVQEDNYNDDAFDDSDDEDSVDENAFDDSIDELLFDEFNSYLSQKSHDPV